MTVELKEMSVEDRGIDQTKVPEEMPSFIYTVLADGTVERGRGAEIGENSVDPRYLRRY